MFRPFFLVALTLACSTVAFSQKPCQSIPLQMGLNLGSTSNNGLIGLGVNDPYFVNSGGTCANLGWQDSREKWYSWTAPSSGTLQATTCPGYAPNLAFANFDTSLTIWTGTQCSGPLTYIACDGDGPVSPCDLLGYGYPTFGIGSALSVAVTAGTTYWIRINGAYTWEEGPYGLYAWFFPNSAFTLSLTRPSPNLLQVDIANGSPLQPYFTVVSFEAPNHIPAYYGLGWWFGLHVSLSELMLQYSINSPPFRGTLDLTGGTSMSLPYTPAFVGIEMAAVTVALLNQPGSPTAPTIATDIALFVF